MQEKLEKIICHYGVNNQQRKLIEELFELEEAITIYQKDIEEGDPNSVITSIIIENNLNHIAEEMADVLVLLEQFRIFYGIDLENVKKIGRRKIDRQINRIEEK